MKDTVQLESEVLKTANLQSPHCELAIIGCLFQDPAKMDYVVSLVEPRDFYSTDCRILFTHLCNLHEAGRPISDLSIVRDHIKSAGDWESIGGAKKIAECATSGIITSIDHYACEIIRTSRLRSLLNVLVQACDMCSDRLNEVVKADSIVEWLDAKISGLGIIDEPPHITDAKVVGERLMNEMLQAELSGESNGGPTIETGIEQIDVNYAGIMAPNYIVIAAQPGGGKSAIAKQIGNHMSLNGKRVLFVSLEMSADEVCHRLWSERCLIDGKKIAKGSLTVEEKLKLDDSIQGVVDEHFMISTPTGKDARWSRIAASARLLKSTKGLDVLFLDYIQLLEEEYRGQKAYEKVTEASRSIKQIARELNIPVFVLSQFNAEGESADSGSGPKVSNMRDSRAMGQDADNIWFLVPTKTDSIDIDLHVKKARGDMKSRFPMRLDGPHTRLLTRHEF